MGLQETSIFFQNIRHRHFYLCDYLPLHSGIDTVSRSLLKFKRGAQPDLGNWIDRAVCGFCEAGPVLPEGTVIVRALHHKEMVADPAGTGPLNLLGRGLEGAIRGTYLPGLLCKLRRTTINQGLTREERENELRDVYRMNPAVCAGVSAAGEAGPVVPLSLLVVDDILTTGATVLAILKTLHGAWPDCPVTVFTLAKVA